MEKKSPTQCVRETLIAISMVSNIGNLPVSEDEELDDAGFDVVGGGLDVVGAGLDVVDAGLCVVDADVDDIGVDVVDAGVDKAGFDVVDACADVVDADVDVIDSGVDVVDAVVDVLDADVDVLNAGVDVVDAGVDVVDAWVNVVDAGVDELANGVDAAAITLLVRLSTAPSIMQSIIIPVLYFTWQYAPLGRPRTITYLYVYNNYCVIVTNINFKSLKTQNSQILDEEFNENTIELHIYKAPSHILFIN